jgi:hypothetical protein
VGGLERSLYLGWVPVAGSHGHQLTQLREVHRPAEFVPALLIHQPVKTPGEGRKE